MKTIDRGLVQGVIPAQAKSPIWNPQERFWCFQCDQTGVTQARKDDWLETGEGPYAFRCSCTLGQRDRRLFPIWRQQAGFHLIKR